MTVKNEKLFRVFIQQMTLVQVESAWRDYSKFGTRYHDDPGFIGLYSIEELEETFAELEYKYGDSFDLYCIDMYINEFKKSL